MKYQALKPQFVSMGGWGGGVGGGVGVGGVGGSSGGGVGWWCGGGWVVLWGEVVKLSFMDRYCCGVGDGRVDGGGGVGGDRVGGR